MRCTRHISLPGMVEEIHELWQSRHSEVRQPSVMQGYPWVLLCAIEFTLGAGYGSCLVCLSVPALAASASV